MGMPTIGMPGGGDRCVRSDHDGEDGGGDVGGDGDGTGSEGYVCILCATQEEDVLGRMKMQ